MSYPIAVIDAVKRMEKLKEIISNMKYKTYVGLSKRSRFGGIENLINVNRTITENKVVVGDRGRWDSTPTKILKENFTNIEHAITRLQDYATAINDFNNREYIMMGCKKIKIADAILEIEKLQSLEEFYGCCRAQQLIVESQRNTIDNIVGANTKMENPNNVNSSYDKKIKELQEQRKKILKKIDKKYNDCTINI